jgi:2-polyprenyl-3-methyl-5-hydroxy-6-metoxy-1,4-benzoquinol methylase
MKELTSCYGPSGPHRRMLAEAVFDRYVSYFKQWSVSGSRVLDIGCGVGTSTRLLREAGFSALAPIWSTS